VLLTFAACTFVRIGPVIPSAPDWLGAARGAREELATILGRAATTAERARETGARGHGGDWTLEIDAAAETAVFDRLEALAGAGHRFTAYSEERGEVDFDGDPAHPVLVVIDPLDGSRNAKRRLSHYALSLAVAEGRTMADVVFGYVYDFGPGEEWVAWRGGGATLNGVALDPGLGEHRVRGRLELVGVESADPRWIRDAAGELVEVTHRLRTIGAIAVSLCQVAAARLDGMATLKRARAVDVAAGQLIVREAGGHVAFTACADPLGAPLDAPGAVSPVVAARTQAGLRELARLS
jgi:myo-inositol-1(or 4)-monophosphatase